MPEEQIKAFYEFFYSARKALAPIELDALNDCEIGLITKEDMNTIIGEQAYLGYTCPQKVQVEVWLYAHQGSRLWNLRIDSTSFESEDNHNDTN